MSRIKSLLILPIVIVFLIPKSNAQSYSQLIDHGFDNQHLIRDYHFESDSLIILMNHRCEDSFDCFTVNNLNVSLPDSLEYYLELNDIKVGNYHGLIVEEDRIVISSHDDNNGFDKIMINQLDLLYDSLITYEFLSEDSIRYFNDGVLEYLGEYYVWGEGRDLKTNIPNGHVIKLDSSLTKIIGQWYFSYGDKSSHLNDLQIQPDGHLSFLVQSDSDIDGVKDSLHIVKIDTLGQIVDELSIAEGSGLIRLTFHTLRNGNYVIMNFRETIFGRVQCIDHQTHEVLWDYEFPKGKFNEFNNWSIWDYHEADDGDIIACGYVMEIIDDKWGGPQLVAYALRLTQDGEYVWLKRFLVPNETNPEVVGPYHYNNFTHVMERDNGQLLLLGESTQINRPPPNQQYAWILALDENDCYKGNCSDTVIIDKRLSNKLKYELGAKWTYERVWNGSTRVDFQTFEVTDTLTIDTLSCFIISDRDTICTVDNRVYSKNINNDLENGLQLLYDFDSDNNYNTQCNRLGYGAQEYNISVDSITTETIADGQLINVHYLSDDCYPIERKIYEGIGSSYSYPFPCVNFCNDLSDPVIYELTTLRCFENTTESYEFVNYACDSTWMSVNTKDIVDRPYLIYPNPTDGVVYIEHAPRDLHYRLTDLRGRLIAHGSYNDKGIRIIEQGVYFITLYTDDSSWTEKVIKY